MKLLVLDSHEVVRAGIRAVFAKRADLIIFEAAYLEEATEMARSTRPDICIAGAGGPDMLRTISALHNALPTLRILSHPAEDELESEALAAGAVAHVSKTAGLASLIKAVEAAISAETEHPPVVVSHREELTRRERQVLALLGEGMSLAAIATEVGLTYKSVSHVCGRIKAKLAIRSNVALVSFAVAQNLSETGPKFLDG